MTLDEIIASLFPDGHQIRKDGGVIAGSAKLRAGGRMLVIGVTDRTALGVDEALRLSRHVLESIDRDTGPILVLVDSDSQRMSKRDELLGLNEFLAHLAKVLIHADMHGRPTIGILYGHSAAGALLATGLATRVLVGLPGASPAVMDLPSMAKVTKLSMEALEEKAESTPVFAPGLSNLEQMGAIHMIWSDAAPLVDQLEALLADMPAVNDRRDALGKARGGRPKAADIVERVRDLALQIR
ncbi:biotin-independent malonate decarboxylase subunit gamma [Bradyrhizobium daqingense]|uniref:Malonate decarboxylase gamma subunit n=1 Tax=Bradyrhizobium daqingense TaxID=993502 RepID=A0A562KRT8_9BRAD|nr:MULTISPECIES: biotin-independent malonate decarboxylase subunit gamma [Bradyrhizobium]MDQ8731691.1 biotin-independent malonate decarboxylase subunit gamma [Bradyrhizobium sp. LHD-71]TWH97913.1 malonate decarboxylase gamma subunit [Bradyrhizobium daqingense]UFS91583.1 biotin-independent malonate decarboxylase subunit gamma [Bradyrhizobium daqingense]